MQWLVNTSLLKVICRGVWLCKLTYPVIYRLTLNKSDLRQTSTILNIIEAITFNLSNKDNHLWNDMIAVLSAKFTHVSATQTVFWCKLNYQIEPKTNKGKCEAKQHKVIPTMQQTRRNRQNRAWLAQRLWTENKLCKEHNQRQFLWPGTFYVN